MEVRVEVYLPKLEHLSDRTLGKLLSLVGRVIRRVTRNETAHLVDQMDLSSSERQSLRDRLKPELESTTAYYFDEVQRGSITLSLTLAATGIYLLKKTIGASVSEAWKKGRIHEFLVDILSWPVRGSTSKEPQADPRAHPRWNFLQTQFEYHFTPGRIFDRLEVVDLQFTPDSEANMVIRVTLGLLEQFAGRVDGRRLDVAGVLETWRQGDPAS